MQEELFSPDVRALIYNNQVDAIIAADHTGKLLMFNKTAARLFGSPVSIKALLRPEDHDQEIWRVSDVNGVELPTRKWPFMKARQGFLLSEDVFWMERRDTHVKFPVSINSTIYKDTGDGRLVTVFAARDLTQKKAVEQEALRHLHDLMKLVEVSREVVACRDRTEILSCSARAAASICATSFAAAQFHYTENGFLHSAFNSDEARDMIQKDHYQPMLRVYASLLFQPLLHLTEADIKTHPAWWGTEGGSIPLKELLAVRLEDENGKADGWILVGRKDGDRFTAPDEFILGQVASLVSLSLRQVGFQESLEAQRDQLEKLTRKLKALNQSLEVTVEERTKLAEYRSRQLLALNVELVEAEEKERSRLADLLHEDLQQILASALLLLQKLQADSTEGNGGRSIITRIMEILQESLSKARYLSYELSPPVLHHAGLLPAIQWLSRRMKDQYGLEVSVDSGQWGGLEEKTIRSLFYRSIQELLFNVVKHAGTHAAEVRLSHADGFAVVEISDKGSGFDASTLRASGGAGEGFGLMAIQERIQAMGGRFEVESSSQGTRVTIAVPVTPVAEAAAAPPTPTGAAAASAAPGSLFRVLLVDDHKVMRQGLTALLRGQRDIQVVGEAANGREAVEMAKSLKPTVIVMDVVMPEMDGVEATRRIKADNPDVRVVGLSMMEEMSGKMREAGADCLVSKTASTGVLLRAIYGLPEQGGPG